MTTFVKNHTAIYRCLIPFIISLFLISSCVTTTSKSSKEGDFASMRKPQISKTMQTIAFGSCADAYKPQPLWAEIQSSKPDVFLLLGDNVYADKLNGKNIPIATEESFKAAYSALDQQKEFSRFRRHIPILATWDDHDYGFNDGGIDNPVIPLAKKFFLNFFNIPLNSPVRQHEGVYSANIYGEAGKRVQIILLDTRSFRSALTKAKAGNAEGYQRYRPSTADNQQMLGEQQWAWLAEQLSKPAEIRIIASSIQILAENHGYERWGNLPKERQRLYDLLTRTRANGVVLFSGDRHQGGLYRKTNITPYPLIEVTASSINVPIAHPSLEMDETQVGHLVQKPNFGLLHINWDKKLISFGVNIAAKTQLHGLEFPFKDIQIEPATTKK